MKNILCVDLEDWYNANLADLGNVQKTSRIENNTYVLLELFRQYGVKATFFVVGEIAEKFPGLVRKILDNGHEIGCHSYAHKLVYSLTPDEFREDTKKAKELLERVTGEKVNSYRAPSWSITESSFWALGILKEEGFKYDSSIFPFKNFLYGVADAPRFPYNSSKYDSHSDLEEIPPSTLRILGINIPFSGGFYFRALPLWVVKSAFSWFNRKEKPVVFYIHPWEIDSETPRLKLNCRDRVITYFGIKKNKNKFEKLLKKYKFTSIQDYLCKIGND